MTILNAVLAIPPLIWIGLKVVLAILAALLLAIPPLIWIGHEVAKKKWQASYPSEGNIEFVVTGETSFRTLANIKDHHFDPLTGDIVDNKITPPPPPKGLMAWLRKNWGWFWVSWLYPLRKIHRWKIDKEWVADYDSGNTSTDWIKREKDVEISSLRFRFPRPFLITGAEFSDKFTADLLVYLNFEIVNPYKTVFLYQGNFFPLLQAPIDQAVNDFCLGMTYKDFVTLMKGARTKTRPGVAAFQEQILKINGEVPQRTPGTGVMVTSRLPGGIVERYGIRALSVELKNYELTADSKAQDDALKAEETKKLEALGKIAEATGDAESIRLRGKGRADALKLLGEAADPEVVKTALMADAIDNFDGQVLALGGGNTAIALPAVGPKDPNRQKNGPRWWKGQRHRGGQKPKNP